MFPSKRKEHKSIMRLGQERTKETKPECFIAVCSNCSNLQLAATWVGWGMSPCRIKAPSFMAHCSSSIAHLGFLENKLHYLAAWILDRRDTWPWRGHSRTSIPGSFQSQTEGRFLLFLLLPSKCKHDVLSSIGPLLPKQGSRCLKQKKPKKNSLLLHV